MRARIFSKNGRSVPGIPSLGFPVLLLGDQRYLWAIGRREAVERWTWDPHLQQPFAIDIGRNARVHLLDDPKQWPHRANDGPADGYGDLRLRLAEPASVGEQLGGLGRDLHLRWLREPDRQDGDLRRGTPTPRDGESGEQPDLDHGL